MQELQQHYPLIIPEKEIKTIKIDQIKETARMIKGLTDEKGVVNVTKSLTRDQVELQLLEETFLEQFPEYQKNEDWSPVNREIYVLYPDLKIFALQPKEVK